MEAPRTQVGYEKARKAILAGEAKPHPLWLLLSDERQRDGFALKPAPWDGPGEYQRVSFADGTSGLVRLPDNKHLPKSVSA